MGNPFKGIERIISSEGKTEDRVEMVRKKDRNEMINKTASVLANEREKKTAATIEYAAGCIKKMSGYNEEGLEELKREEREVEEIKKKFLSGNWDKKVREKVSELLIKEEVPLLSEDKKVLKDIEGLERAKGAAKMEWVREELGEKCKRAKEKHQKIEREREEAAKKRKWWIWEMQMQESKLSGEEIQEALSKGSK